MYNLDMIIEETEKQMEDLFLDVETDTGETLYNLAQEIIKWNLLMCATMTIKHQKRC